MQPLFTGRGLLAVGGGITPARMLEGVLQHRPEVVVLELGAGEAPLQAIEAVMAERPTPILVLHSPGTDPFRAMALGALDMVDLRSSMSEAFWDDLAKRLLLLAQVRVVQHVRGKRHRRPNAPPERTAEAPFPVVAIASSLGGPRALSQLLTLLPPKLPAPICICQHISDGFTWGLANWLAAETGHSVVEARDHEQLEPGTIYVAPSRVHFCVDATGIVRLDRGPPLQGFRPSCDALLRSVAESFGRRTVGVILTGMGKDGAAGLRAIRDRGGRTIAQDEASCVVYGMPKEAVELGAAQEILPLDKIPQTVVRWVYEC